MSALQSGQGRSPELELIIMLFDSPDNDDDDDDDDGDDDDIAEEALQLTLSCLLLLLQLQPALAHVVGHGLQVDHRDHLGLCLSQLDCKSTPGLL